MIIRLFIGLVLCVVLSAVVYAAPTYYSTLSSFNAAVATTVTDDYSSAGYQYTSTTPDILTNTEMDAVFLQSDYSPITHADLNIVGYLSHDRSSYCSGCNGDFQLDFDNTSVTINGGVYGVGFDTYLIKSSDDQPQKDLAIIITYANGEREQTSITAIGYDHTTGQFNETSQFWGVTDSRGIASLRIGDIQQFVIIDNLIVGSEQPIATGYEGVRFSASKMVVDSGTESTTLSWYAPDQSGCTASGGWSGTKANQGHEVIASLTAETDFTLTCGTNSETFTVKIAGSIDFADKATNHRIYELNENHWKYSWQEYPVGAVYNVPSQYATMQLAINAVNAAGDGYEYGYHEIRISGTGTYDCYARIDVKYVMIRGADAVNRPTCNTDIWLNRTADYIVIQNMIMDAAEPNFGMYLSPHWEGTCHFSTENTKYINSNGYAIINAHCFSTMRDETSFLRIFNSFFDDTLSHNVYCQSVQACISVNSEYWGQHPSQSDYAHNFHAIPLNLYFVGNVVHGVNIGQAYNLDFPVCSKSIVKNNEFHYYQVSGKVMVGLTGYRPGNVVDPATYDKVADPNFCVGFIDVDGAARDEDHFHCSVTPGFGTTVIENNLFYNYRTHPDDDLDPPGNESTIAVRSQSGAGWEIHERWCWIDENTRATDPNSPYYWCSCSVNTTNPYEVNATFQNNTLYDVPKMCVDHDTCDHLLNTVTNTRVDTGTALALLQAELDTMGNNEWKELRGTNDSLVWENVILDVASMQTIQHAAPIMSGIANASGGNTSTLVDNDSDFITGNVIPTAEALVHSTVRNEGTGEVEDITTIVSATQMTTVPASTTWNSVSFTISGLDLYGGQGPASILKNWSGGAWDHTDYVMYVFGGGHGDYGGNEMYAYDLKDMTLTRISDPVAYDTWSSAKTSGQGGWTTATGIEATHTYDAVIYSSVTDTVISLSDTDFGGGTAHNWLGEFDVNNPTAGWVRHGNVNEKVAGLPAGDYRDSNDMIYILNHGPARGSQMLAGMSSVNPTTKEVTHLTYGPYSYMGWGTAEIVTVNGQDYMYTTHSGSIPPGQKTWAMYKWLLDSPYTVTLVANAVDVGWETFTEAPGMAYRSINDALYIWAQDKELYVMDIDTETWSTLTPTTGPDRDLVNGTDNGVYGRFVYIPEVDAFIGINAVQDQGVWIYKP